MPKNSGYWGEALQTTSDGGVVVADVESFASERVDGGVPPAWVLGVDLTRGQPPLSRVYV